MKRSLPVLALTVLVLALLCSPARAIQTFAGVRNGLLPAADLAPIPGGYLLQKDAAVAFNAMNAASIRRFGVGIAVRDGYRPLGLPGDYGRGHWSQWYAWERYVFHGGNLAASPGTSNHGWGAAIDLYDCGPNRYRLNVIGSRFGFSKSWSDAPGECWHILYKPGIFVTVWTPNFHGPPHESKGPNIGLMTLRLKRLGYLKTAPYQFNPTVVGAVIRFQNGHHLVADGLVGPVTWYAIKGAHR